MGRSKGGPLESEVIKKDLKAPTNQNYPQAPQFTGLGNFTCA